MSWLLTIITAVITAAIGTVASGYVADLSVRWYRVSSFEGGSSYYTLMFALLGLVVGFVLGLVVSRVVAASAAPSIVKALGYSIGSMLLLVAAVGGTGRALADVPPTFDGETLMLVVEARWPVTRIESPANAPGTSFLELGSVTSMNVQRISKRGALWKEDARKVDGQWMAEGAVPIFTERGKPVLKVALNESESAAFTLQLPSHPDKKDFAWSDWFPKDGKSGPTKTSDVTFRYRVQKRSQVVRRETVGAFAIDMIASDFLEATAPGTTTLDAWGTFKISYHPAPVAGAANHAVTVDSQTKIPAGAVAVLPGPTTALLVLSGAIDPDNSCALLVDDDGTLRRQGVANCSTVITAQEITTDGGPSRLTESARALHGSVDRFTYRDSKYLLFDKALLDVSALRVHKFTADLQSASRIPSVPPLGISPDRGSFALFYKSNGSDSRPLIVVTNYVRDTVYELPIDVQRMRYFDLEDATPAWFTHYFAWQRNEDGFDHLVIRPGVAPMPYHGTYTVEQDGKQYFKIPRVGQDIRLAIVQMMEADFGATRDSVPDDSYNYPMHIEGVTLNVSRAGYQKDKDYVMVSLGDNEKPSNLVERIGKAFNLVLATGRYDAAFTN